MATVRGVSICCVEKVEAEPLLTQAVVQGAGSADQKLEKPTEWSQETYRKWFKPFFNGWQAEYIKSAQAVVSETELQDVSWSQISKEFGAAMAAQLLFMLFHQSVDMSFSLPIFASVLLPIPFGLWLIVAVAAFESLSITYRRFSTSSGDQHKRIGFRMIGFFAGAALLTALVVVKFSWESLGWWSLLLRAPYNFPVWLFLLELIWEYLRGNSIWNVPILAALRGKKVLILSNLSEWYMFMRAMVEDDRKGEKNRTDNVFIEDVKTQKGKNGEEYYQLLMQGEVVPAGTYLLSKVKVYQDEETDWGFKEEEGVFAACRQGKEGLVDSFFPWWSKPCELLASFPKRNKSGTARNRNDVELEDDLAAPPPPSHPIAEWFFNYGYWNLSISGSYDIAVELTLQEHYHGKSVGLWKWISWMFFEHWLVRAFAGVLLFDSMTAPARFIIMTMKVLFETHCGQDLGAGPSNRQEHFAKWLRSNLDLTRTCNATDVLDFVDAFHEESHISSGEILLPYVLGLVMIYCFAVKVSQHRHHGKQVAFLSGLDAHPNEKRQVLEVDSEFESLTSPWTTCKTWFQLFISGGTSVDDLSWSPAFSSSTLNAALVQVTEKLRFSFGSRSWNNVSCEDEVKLLQLDTLKVKEWTVCNKVGLSHDEIKSKKMEVQCKKCKRTLTKELPCGKTCSSFQCNKADPEFSCAECDFHLCEAHTKVFRDDQMSVVRHAHDRFRTIGKIEKDGDEFYLRITRADCQDLLLRNWDKETQEKLEMIGVGSTMTWLSFGDGDHDHTMFTCEEVGHLNPLFIEKLFSTHVPDCGIDLTFQAPPDDKDHLTSPEELEELCRKLKDCSNKRWDMQFWIATQAGIHDERRDKLSSTTWTLAVWMTIPPLSIALGLVIPTVRVLQDHMNFFGSHWYWGILLGLNALACAAMLAGFLYLFTATTLRLGLIVNLLDDFKQATISKSKQDMDEPDKLQPFDLYLPEMKSEQDTDLYLFWEPHWHKAWASAVKNVQQWQRCQQYLRVLVSSVRLIAQAVLVAAFIILGFLIVMSIMNALSGKGAFSMDMSKVMDKVHQATSQGHRRLEEVSTEVQLTLLAAAKAGFSSSLRNASATLDPFAATKLLRSLEPHFHDLEEPLGQQMQALLPFRRLDMLEEVKDSGVSLSTMSKITKTQGLTIVMALVIILYSAPLIFNIARINDRFEEHVDLLSGVKTTHGQLQALRERQIDLFETSKQWALAKHREKKKQELEAIKCQKCQGAMQDAASAGTCSVDQCGKDALRTCKTADCNYALCNDHLQAPDPSSPPLVELEIVPVSEETTLEAVPAATATIEPKVPSLPPALASTVGKGKAPTGCCLPTAAVPPSPTKQAQPPALSKDASVTMAKAGKVIYLDVEKKGKKEKKHKHTEPEKKHHKAFFDVDELEKWKAYGRVIILNAPSEPAADQDSGTSAPAAASSGAPAAPFASAAAAGPAPSAESEAQAAPALALTDTAQGPGEAPVALPSPTGAVKKDVLAKKYGHLEGQYFVPDASKDEGLQLYVKTLDTGIQSSATSYKRFPLALFGFVINFPLLGVWMGMASSPVYSQAMQIAPKIAMQACTAVEHSSLFKAADSISKSRLVTMAEKAGNIKPINLQKLFEDSVCKPLIKSLEKGAEEAAAKLKDKVNSVAQRRLLTKKPLQEVVLDWWHSQDGTPEDKLGILELVLTKYKRHARRRLVEVPETVAASCSRSDWHHTIHWAALVAEEPLSEFQSGPELLTVV